MNYQASSWDSTDSSNIYSRTDLPLTVVRRLDVGSPVMSMDFHPQQHGVLAVGTYFGSISIWKVGSQERLLEKTFKIWNISTFSMPFLITCTPDVLLSVVRCVWSPDGSILGVAFSKHIVQIYTYDPRGVLTIHLEIDAHIGGVYDIAFCHPNGQLCIITCGEDKTIKMWDFAGRKLCTYEGHEAPVFSICPRQRDNIQSFFSNSVNGRRKLWRYDSFRSIVDYGAPGVWCTRLAYSPDGTRLFASGTNKEGICYLAELDDRTEGGVKRLYSGLRRHTTHVVQFATSNRFLAAGDDFRIKIWDMNNTNMLTYSYADSQLHECPGLRFNEDGSLLAVATTDCGIKIFANAEGLRMLSASWLAKW